jgi:carbamoyl-phosphate synthase large subunit
MPLDESLDKVLILGSGPIVIGQAAEFDFSGSQAALAVNEEGIETVVVNSNPATIQTDRQMASKVYVEPLETDVVERILEKEDPDGILSGMGGQTALNICTELAERGALEEYDVELLGTPLDAINRSEDRELFKDTMREVDEPVTEAHTVSEIEEAIEVAEDLGYPVLVRPAYTLGGTGGGVADDRDELVDIAARGLQASRIDQVLIERSLEGWQEYEYEVMRDAEDNTIIVCNMENIDPMGLHTGESAVVAPSQTLADHEHQQLRSSALHVIRNLDIQGGCNIQFAVNPETRDYIVIEVNPRVSRSSALASKATGYPIARVAAKIACGYTLDEIPNAITRETPASFEPSIDYIVTKIPRWPFDKFPHIDRQISTQMKSTGEAMGIGRTFEESFLKCLRSLDLGDHALMWPDASQEQLDEALDEPTDQRLHALGETFRRGATVKTMREQTKIHPWYLRKLKRIVDVLEDAGEEDPLDPDALREAKANGGTDADLARRWNVDQAEVREARYDEDLDRTYKMVDTCAAEFEATTPYYYGTFESTDEVEHHPPEDGLADSIVVVGGGPIRIGQGIEFDYCCVHAAQAIKDHDRDAVMVNNNPETVSTDFDTSDRLYFEPLELEDVLSVVRREKAEGVMLQFGGQTSVNLAVPLAEALEEEGLDTQVLGTSPEAMDICEDRERFTDILDELKIPYPAAGSAASLDEAREIAADIGYPVLVRPSYVLGGRAMQIVYEEEDLEQYVDDAAEVSPEHELLIDNFLDRAVEVDVDAVSDGENVLVGGIMEHVEEAGVHSGDSTCLLPPQSLSPEVLDTIRVYTRKLARRLGVKGLLNIQYAVKDEEVHVLEANPRASRTVPFVSKSVGVPLAKLASRVMLGESLADMDVNLDPEPPRVACKAPVFPFLKLSGLDTILGPEMKSTGEVLGLADDAGIAYDKAMTAAKGRLPDEGTVYITVRDEDKPRILPVARTLDEAGFDIVATKGTAQHLRSFGVDCETVWRIREDHSPDAIDLMRKGEIDLIINTPTTARGARADAFNMRRLAVDLGIPFITTTQAARAAARAIDSRDEDWPVEALEDLHPDEVPVARAAGRDG